MKALLKTLCLVWLCIFYSSSYAQQATLTAVSYTDDGQGLRLLFDRSAPKNRLFVLKNPTRLVIDLKDARLDTPLEQPGSGHPVLAGVRAAVRNDRDIRLVLDLKQVLTPENFSYQTDALGTEFRVNVAAKPETADLSQAGTPQARAWVVVIDAGHGGSDSGALGVNGTQEKDVTLQIARKLLALCHQQEGIKAVLTRTDDRFIALRKRIAIARQANADLFVSIHADAYEDASVQGASVYTLSKHGASSEAARWLAEKENGADLLGGITLDDNEGDLATVLLDLSQNATLEHSSLVANAVLKNFAKVSRLHKDNVQKAGFIVLKAPDIPSILVETAFISNPADEKKLSDARYQDQVAEAIYRGIVSYFNQAGPVSSKIAAL